MRKSLAVLAAAAVAASGLAVVAASPATAATTAVTAASSAPKRNDGLGEPIYFVHGIQASVTGHPKANCNQWNTAIKAYKAGGHNSESNTVAYYKGDTNCNTRIGSYENGVGVKELGRKLAWDIYNRYTKNGRSVDVVGHSMGGLIIRAAVTGVAKKEKNWPSKLYVEDAVTIGTPHTGTKWWAKACKLQACKDMAPGSAFMKWLTPNPQSAQGTDWTVIGSADDKVVAWKSAISFNEKTAGSLKPGHKVVFSAGQGLGHSDTYVTASGAWNSFYWNQREGKKANDFTNQAKGASPVVVARNANYYWRLW
jgi:pimeloyl-ACP methyl ester carboxylesterase